MKGSGYFSYRGPATDRAPAERSLVSRDFETEFTRARVRGLLRALATNFRRRRFPRSGKLARSSIVCREVIHCIGHNQCARDRCQQLRGLIRREALLHELFVTYLEELLYFR
jgi:hypothetical protein